MSRPKPKQNEFTHLHIEVETKQLEQLRLLRPGYGEVSRVIRQLIKGFLSHVTTPKP